MSIYYRNSLYLGIEGKCLDIIRKDFQIKLWKLFLCYHNFCQKYSIVLASVTKQKTNGKGHEKGEIKLSLFADDMNMNEQIQKNLHLGHRTY